MCMITYLPADVEVPEEEILNGASWNDDGHGWAVAAETGVLLTGRYMAADVAMETFKATRAAFPHAPAMFHSRYATHGTISLPNVHPFMVGKFAAVAHNGILPGKFQPAGNEAMSDTAIMANYWLAGRAQVSGIWTRKERKRIANIIGKGNKLCILSVSPFLPEPRAYLVNAQQGYWDNLTGAWFSAHDYQYGLKSAAKGSGRFGYGNWWDEDDWKGTTGTGYASIPKPVTYGACPNCNTSSEIDSASGVCLYCDFCLDCLSMLRECQCGYPEGLILTADEAKGLGEAIENPTMDEIEIVLTEMDGKPFSTPNKGKRS
jgi:hypothetical protein